MQRCSLTDAYIFISFHNKVAIQQKHNSLIKHLIYPFTGQSFIGQKVTYLVTLDNMYELNYHSTGVEIFINYRLSYVQVIVNLSKFYFYRN
jgi:hypothetical protein